MKQRWQLWVGIAISIVALVLALRNVDFGQLAASLGQAEYIYFIPASVAMLAYLIARAVRWCVLLGPGVSLARSFWVGNIGYLFSNVLPFRLGDPARAVAIGLDGKVKVSAALSTVVVERVLDLLTVVVLLAVTLPHVTQAGWMQQAGIAAGVAASGALAALFVLAWRPDWVRRVARWALVRVPRLNPDRWMHILDGLLEGLSPLRSVRRALLLLLWSVVAWVFVVGYYWAMLCAFLDRPPLVEASFLTCATGLGMAVPSAPGAVGVFETTARYALELPFSVIPDKALAVAIVSHGFSYVAICLLGLVGLTQLGLSWGRLRAGIATTLDAETTGHGDKETREQGDTEG